MNIDIDRAALTLERNAVLAFDHARRARILCTYGALWITLDDDPRDIILAAGESFVVDRDARVLVTAVRPSSLLLLDPLQTDRLE